MKNIIAIALMLSLLMPLICVGSISVYAENPLTNVATGDEQPINLPTAEDLNGYENICLTYTFRNSSYDKGRIYEDAFMPYVAYLDKQGDIQDYFFDSYLFLPCMDYGPSGARMHLDASNPTKAIDWTSYVNDTFCDGANVDALDTAFGKAKAALGDTDTKAGVFFTILYPCAGETNFGNLGGKRLDFSQTEDRKYAIKWIIDEQIRLYNKADYDNLDLVGFYWLEEYIVSEADVELFQYASEYLHSLGLKFIWIPWYLATGYDRGAELGFDAVCMQPNLFWLGYTDPNRVEESINISNEYGMGMEIELDYRVGSDYYFNRYLYYLEGGMNSDMMNSVKMYYQDSGPGVYYEACYSDYGNLRSVYDLTYKYAKGILTQADIDACRPQGEDDNFVDDIGLNDILESADWISIGKSYTGCPSYVDGNGADYQKVSGNELTDGIIATEDLSTDWFAFHTYIRDEEGRMSVTIDLGEIRNDLKHFAAHFDNKQLYAIGAPMDICIYTSTDGVNYKLLATPELVLDPVNSGFLYQCEAVTARYVKLSIGRSDKIYVFCSEFLVGIDKSEKEEPKDETKDESKDEPKDETNKSEDYILGDVNGNGSVDMTDYILTKRAYFGTYMLNEDELKRADVNITDAIDMTDYILVKRIYFGTYTVK